MENPELDLYAIEFENVYDIDFAVLDDAVLEETSKPEVVTTQAAPNIGGVALSNEILDSVREALAEPIEIETVDFYEIPAEMIDLVNTAVSTVLESSTKRIIPIAMVVDVAFGQRVPKEIFKDFRNALDLDPRLEHIGSGEYLVKDREVSDPYWPDEDPGVDEETISTLVDNVVSVMTEAAWGHFKEPQILGIAKAQSGDYLTRSEINELLALLASHPRIRPLEDGSFSVRKDPPPEPGDAEDLLPMVSLDFDIEPKTEDKPMTDKQVNKTLQKLRSSPEFREAKVEAKRLANPRRRGRSKKGQAKKLMGRTHGKKQSLDTLIAKLSEPAT